VGDKEAQRLIDECAQRKVFYRGFIFQCEFCKASNWFAAGDITDRFTCPRCHREQLYTSLHWKWPQQPNWYHQLDEIVYLAFANDMQVPVLALDALRRRSKDSFLFTPELNYFSEEEDKPFVESDLNFVCDGSLGIGEAKKGTDLGPTKKEELALLDKYSGLIDALHPKQIVFATEADDWSESTKQNISHVLSSRPVEILLLGKKDLYSVRP